MKKILFPIFTLLSISFFITSCDKNDKEEQLIDYSYHAHIHSPAEGTMNLNDTLEIEVEFESHSGEAVHHIKIRIFNAANNTEVYNQPGEAHVHEMSGVYEFQDELILSEANGFSANTNWMLEASVWGEEAGDGEELEKKEFFILP